MEDDALGSSSPRNKRARTSYDIFVDQELDALASQPFVSEQLVKRVTNGLQERWDSMSADEMRLYADLAADAEPDEVAPVGGDGHKQRTSAPASALHIGRGGKSDAELLKLSPAVQNALTKFLAVKR
jgi:hypothetical protein